MVDIVCLKESSTTILIEPYHQPRKSPSQNKIKPGSQKLKGRPREILGQSL